MATPPPESFKPSMRLKYSLFKPNSTEQTADVVVSPRKHTLFHPDGTDLTSVSHSPTGSTSNSGPTTRPSTANSKRIIFKPSDRLRAIVAGEAVDPSPSVSANTTARRTTRKIYDPSVDTSEPLSSPLQVVPHIELRNYADQHYFDIPSVTVRDSPRSSTENGDGAVYSLTSTQYLPGQMSVEESRLGPEESVHGSPMFFSTEGAQQQGQHFTFSNGITPRGGVHRRNRMSSDQPLKVFDELPRVEIVPANQMELDGAPMQSKGGPMKTKYQLYKPQEFECR